MIGSVIDIGCLRFPFPGIKCFVVSITHAQIETVVETTTIKLPFSVSEVDVV